MLKVFWWVDTLLITINYQKVIQIAASNHFYF